MSELSDISTKVKICKIFIPTDEIYNEYCYKMESHLEFRNDLSELINTVLDMCDKGSNTYDIRYFNAITNIINSFLIQNNLMNDNLRNITED